MIKTLPKHLKFVHRLITRWLAPLWPLLVVTWVSCYLLPVPGKKVGLPRTGGEFYPFSSFPMYSTNEEKTYMVFLTDDEGNPIGAQAVFGVRTSSLKKDYHRELNELARSIGMKQYDMSPEEKEPAARDTLEYLIHERAPDRAKASGLKAVRMVDRRIFWRKGKLVHEDGVVGRVEIPSGEDA